MTAARLRKGRAEMTDRNSKPRHMWSVSDWLRGAADVLRRTARNATPGPWRWGDWRARPGTLEQNRTRLERSPAHGAFPTIRQRVDVGEAVLPGLEDPLDAFEEELGRVSPRANANARWMTLLTPSAAEPLASLLDSLAQSAEQITQAGGSVDDEPYRSAEALAKLIVQEAESVTAGGRMPV